MASRGRTRAGPGLLVMALMLAAGCQMSESRATIDIDQLGPQVGERVADFTLPDQHGNLVSLESILRPNGAILMFYRSADW